MVDFRCFWFYFSYYTCVSDSISVCVSGSLSKIKTQKKPKQEDNRNTNIGKFCFSKWSILGVSGSISKIKHTKKTNQEDNRNTTIGKFCFSKFRCILFSSLYCKEKKKRKKRSNKLVYFFLQYFVQAVMFACFFLTE